MSTTPEAGERLGASPGEVTLQFSEQLPGGAQKVSLRRAEGRPVVLAGVAFSDDGTGLRAGIPALEEGVYLVGWEVLAADGHLSAGEFAFAVGDIASLPGVTARTSEGISGQEAAATGLFLLGLALGAGGLASEAFVWGPVAARRGLKLPLAPVASSLFVSLLGAGLQLRLASAARAGSGAAGGGEASGAAGWSSLVSTRLGLLSLATALFLVYALWILRMRRLRAFALLPLTGAVTTASLSGHPAASGWWWAVPANAVHLALAALWVGALVHLVLVLRGMERAERRALVEAARAYARLALLLVVPLLVFGSVTALALLSRPADLLRTTYGRLLTVKLLLVGAALLLALAARRRALPAVETRPRLLARLTRIEAAALVAVVGVSAVLANAAPPRRALAQSDILGPPPLAGPIVRTADLAGQLGAFLAAAEGELQLRILEPGGEPALGVRARIDGRTPNGRTFDLSPRPCGRGCLSMRFNWSPGPTELRVTVSGGEWVGGTARVQVLWPPGADGSDPLATVIATMREQPEIFFSEQVSSGPGAEPPPRQFRLSGPEFLAAELYAAGGARDIRLMPRRGPYTELSLYIPGSAMWYRLSIDDQHRIRRELIVNPGHRIERTFEY
ncbi:MAG: copper resistance protein CopC [Actinomycetota bacterium]